MHFEETCKINNHQLSCTPMSQVHLIKLVSVGDAKGVGKGHTYYSRKNKKSVERKIEVKKYNPIAKKHTVYKEKKA